MTVRNIVFTWNNYDDNTFNRIANLGWSYCCYGLEVGESGTPHLQGYAEYDRTQKLSTLYKKWSGAHIEAKKGTQAQAIEYCQKDGNFREFGTKKAPGTRTDVIAIRQKVLEEGLQSVVGYASLSSLQAGLLCLTYLEEGRNWKPEVLWVWGSTGCGKSRYSREILNSPYTKSDGTRWWPGYDRHEDVIIDDFRDSWWSLTEMLSLLDCYEKRVECKGGYRQFLARRIVITSAKHPQDCYSNVGEDIRQLLRRIDDIVHLTTHLEKMVSEVSEVVEGNSVPLQLDILG